MLCIERRTEREICDTDDSAVLIDLLIHAICNMPATERERDERNQVNTVLSLSTHCGARRLYDQNPDQYASAAMPSDSELSHGNHWMSYTHTIRTSHAQCLRIQRSIVGMPGTPHGRHRSYYVE